MKTEEITGKLPDSNCDLFFDEAVTSWDEAVPLGNGLSGCLIWGDGSPLRLSLDRGDLWDTRPAPETLHEDFNYKKLIELVKLGAGKDILNLFDNFYGRAAPTKIPAGHLEIKYACPAEKVESHLKLSEACADIKLHFGEKCSLVNTYLHATGLFGYIRISGDADLPQIEIKAPGFGVTDVAGSDTGHIADEKISRYSLKNLRYPPVEWFEQGCLRWFIQKTCEDLEYGIITGQKRTSDTLDIVYIIASNRDGNEWLQNAKTIICDALGAGFDLSMEEHKEWWSRFWNKSSITLYDKAFEKQWYITNYLFGSCSRRGFPPMPLQGVWTADNEQLPPWKGDYHNDLNTQMSYYHYIKANHLEEGESFIDFLWELVPEARKFARNFFDAPGLCLPSVMSIDGKPLGGWTMYSLNLTNQIWLCKAFEDYWKATGDQDFLCEKAYPYFKETALCIVRWLENDGKGGLLLPLSSSPEIHDNTPEAWLTPNSNYDLSLLRYLFKTLCEMSEILGNGEYEVWADKYGRLSELAVNDKNVLMLCPDESLLESHRHLAHAMAVHPLRLLDYDGRSRDKEIIDATIADLEWLGTMLWTGYSFAWMAELYAIQKNGEAAAFQLKLFWENFCSKNGFHLNGDYKNRGLTSLKYNPFTLEGNMCAADALQEMLLKTYGGKISVFPAIPDDWKKYGAAFTDFRGENGVLISSSIKNRAVEYIQLKAEKSGSYKIHNAFKTDRLTVYQQSKAETVDCKINEYFCLFLQAGDECIIKEG